MSVRWTKLSLKLTPTVRDFCLAIALVLSSISSLTAAEITHSEQTPILLDATSLEALAAPVALYPDELLAIVLPASTYPLQIVQAARFIEAQKSNTKLEPDAQWDDSIVALLNYPEALALLNGDLDWTWRLGQAVLNQQGELVQAVSRFRDRAQIAGNLESDDYKQVQRNNDVIEISSTSREQVYVPYYEPTQVIYQQSSPAYYYYPQPRPIYYYPYASNHYFGARTFWGVSTAFTIGWLSHSLNFHNHGYRSHPYYGHRYDRRHHRRHYTRTPRHFARAPQRHHRNYRGDDWSQRRHTGYRRSASSRRYHQPQNFAYAPRNSYSRIQRGNNGSVHRRIKQRDARTTPRQIHRTTNGSLHRGIKQHATQRKPANANARTARNSPRALAARDAHGLGGAALASIGRLPNVQSAQQKRSPSSPARADRKARPKTKQRSNSGHKKPTQAKTQQRSGKSRSNTARAQRKSTVPARSQTRRASNGALGNGAMAARSSRRNVHASSSFRSSNSYSNRRATRTSSGKRASNGTRGNGRRAMGIRRR